MRSGRDAVAGPGQPLEPESTPGARGRTGQSAAETATHGSPPAARQRLWETIATTLRAEISEGTYPPGSKLPSTRAVMQRFKCSDAPARRALRALVDDGYARSEPKSGYIVTRTPEVSGPGASTASPPAPRATHTDLTITHTFHGVPRTDTAPLERAKVTISAEPAPPDIAAALKLADPAQPVILRRRVFSDPATGRPVELRTSYMPTYIANGTSLASPLPVQQPWTEALGEHAPCAPHEQTNATSARHPDDDEATTLGLNPTSVVLVRDITTKDTTGQPIDHTRSVWPAETTRITDTYGLGPDLSPQPPTTPA